jgi:mRNA interferase RelE/StbE
MARPCQALVDPRGGLKGLPAQVKERIEIAIDQLGEEPRPPGAKRLVGCDDEWRLRIGDYRVRYVVDGSVRRITVARVAHRREAYR